MSGNDDKRAYAPLLVGAGLAVALVAALTAWAAQLRGDAWVPLLAPFLRVLAASLAACPGCTAPTPIQEGAGLLAQDLDGPGPC